MFKIRSSNDQHIQLADLTRFLANPKRTVHSAEQLATLASSAIRADMSALFLKAAEQRQIEISPSQQAALARHSLRTATVTMHAMRAFKPLARLLESDGVPFVLMKGMALNLILYKAPDQRLMTDIDFLIHPSDAEKYDRLLQEFGCYPGRGLVRDDFYPQYYYEKEYYTPEPHSIRIDVHVRPLRPLRFAQTVPEKDWWSDAIRFDWEGTNVWLFSHHSMLIHLMAHSAIHGHHRLIWLYDIWHYLHTYRDQVDWGKLRERASRVGLNGAVHSTLSRIASLFQDKEVQALANTIPPRPDWRDDVVFRQAPGDSGRPIRQLLVNLLTTPGIGFRWGYLKRVLFPGESHMREVYTRRHWGWLSVAHLWRLIRTLLRPFRQLAG